MIALADIQCVVDEIVRLFGPEKVILFGSYAYGHPKAGSDVDLLIVMDFDGNSVDQSAEIWSVVRPSFAVDLIVRTSADVVRRYQQFDPLVREAIDKGLVLYERGRARVA